MASEAHDTHTVSIENFKTNPTGVLAEAKGDAVAVLSENQIQFYAVPASLFEEMTAFCEFNQRGTTSMNTIPAKFTGSNIDMEKLAIEMANKIKRRS